MEGGLQHFKFFHETETAKCVAFSEALAFRLQMPQNVARSITKTIIQSPDGLQPGVAIVFKWYQSYLKTTPALVDV